MNAKERGKLQARREIEGMVACALKAGGYEYEGLWTYGVYDEGVPINSRLDDFANGTGIFKVTTEKWFQKIWHQLRE